MSVDKKVPAIRFEGFNCEWDKKILGELVQLENGFAFQSRYFKKYPTEVIVLTPGSVNIGGGFQAGKGQYYDVKQEVLPRYVFEPGDMFITMTDLTPTAQALGFPAIIPRDNNTYLHNQRLGKLVGFKGDLGFLYNLFRTQKKQKEVVSTSSGTTVKHTSPDKFLNRFCYFPKNEEQTQIGNTFQKLDSLINQHQQKHDKLSSIKKSMLEKMFPKQDESLPEIRFKGFSGEWACLTLSELGSVAMNKRIFKHETSLTGEIPFFKIGTFGGQPDAFIRKSLFDDYKARYPYPETGDLLLSASGSIGRIVEYKGEEQYFQDSNIVWLKHDGKIENSFLKVFYSIVRWSGLEGSTIKRLYNKNILDTKILLPQRDEQVAIGNYFQRLDALINQHQQQITKLNNIKQACLRKMFV